MKYVIHELLPTGRTVRRESFTSKAEAENQCYLLNTDLDEENHHYVEQEEDITVTLYGYDEISKRTGVEIGTLRAWKARGKMPEPDFLTMTGRPVPGWLPETIDPWIAKNKKPAGVLAE